MSNGDGVVRLPADGTGKYVDASELTRADGTTVVERQRVVLGDPSFNANLAGITSNGELQTCDAQLADILDTLQKILAGIQLIAGQEIP